MSGGTYDYAYFRISEFAESFNVGHSGKRLALREILRATADICKAIEWEDSGDTGPEATEEAFKEFYARIYAGRETIEKAVKYDEILKLIKEDLK